MESFKKISLHYDLFRAISVLLVHFVLGHLFNNAKKRREDKFNLLITTILFKYRIYEIRLYKSSSEQQYVKIGRKPQEFIHIFFKAHNHINIFVCA
jgi:hypothetical protein